MSATYLFNVTLALVALAFSYFSYTYHKSRAPPALEYRTFSDLTNCTQILGCRSFEGGRNHLCRLASRAIPNQRLIRAFGIDNGFTTEDDGYAKLFKEIAMEKITLNDITWYRITNMATA